MGARAQIVDDAFERLDLRGQLAGGDAVAAVLDLERRVGGSQLIDFASARSTCAPRPIRTGTTHDERRTRRSVARRLIVTWRDDAAGAIRQITIV